MAIPFTCPVCSHRYSLSDNSAGLVGKCPICGAFVRAPETTPRPMPPVARRTHPLHERGPLLAVCVGTALVIAWVCLVANNKDNRPKPQAPAPVVVAASPPPPVARAKIARSEPSKKRQEERAKLIAQLESARVFLDVRVKDGTPRVMVDPGYFRGLNTEQQLSFISLVYCFYFHAPDESAGGLMEYLKDEPSGRCVEIVDRAGNRIGQLSAGPMPYFECD